MTVVIPTLNEEESIGPLIDEIKAAGYGKILVVDGYSKDKTIEVAREHGAVAIVQHGRGKAGAFSTGLMFLDTPYLVVMDGDGSYNPKDIDRFLPFKSKYVFVKGQRERNGIMSRPHRLGNYVITTTFNMLFGIQIPDICSGMYLLRTEEARTLDFSRHPLTLEQEMAAQIVSMSLPVTSVPVSYRKRYGGKSKTNTWRQGFRDLLTNFDLARHYNPILLFSALAMLALVPAVFLLGYASILYILFRSYHGGYFLAGIAFLVLGAQGFTVATLAAMLRRIERKLASINSRSY